MSTIDIIKVESATESITKTSVYRLTDLNSIPFYQCVPEALRGIGCIRSRSLYERRTPNKSGGLYEGFTHIYGTEWGIHMNNEKDSFGVPGHELANKSEDPFIDSRHKMIRVAVKVLAARSLSRLIKRSMLFTRIF